MFKKGFILFMLASLFIFLSKGITFAQMRSLVFGGVRDFVPYEYLDSNGTPAGFNIELIRAIARTRGWNVEIRLMEWSSAMEALRKGTIDAFLGMLFSEERDREFDFSDPHSNVEFAFFTRNDALPIYSLEDLKDRKLGLHELETSLGMLKGRQGFRPIVFKDLKALFTALSRGEVYAALCPKMMGIYWIQKLKISNIRPQANPIYLRQYCFAVREGNRSLIVELNKALEDLKESGEYFRLSKVLFEGMEKETLLDPFYILGALPLLAWICLLGLFITKGRRSIQGRLTVSFIGISLIPLLIIGVLTYFNERGIIKNKVGNHLESTADSKAMLLSQSLEEAKSACRFIAVDPVLVNSLAFTLRTKGDERTVHRNEPEDDQIIRLRSHLQGLVKGWGYDEALILKSDGTVALSTYPTYEGIDMSDNPYFTGAMRGSPGEVYIKDLYYSERTKGLSIAFSTKIQRIKHHFPREIATLGVIVLKVAVDKTVYPLLGSSPAMGHSGEVLLLRKDRDRILFLNNTRHFPDTALKLAFPIVSSSEMVEAALRALKGERGVDEFTDYRGIPVLAAYASIAQTPWALIAKQDKREAFAEIDDLLRRNYFILVGVLLVITLFAFLISRSIARPIRLLDEMTEKVTQGVLDVESDIHQTDEIGRLAESFNMMTQSLKERFTRSERLSALGKLSAGLAHEIRTPLTSIKVTIQSLEKQLALNEDQKEDFSLTKKEIDRLNENVSRFLDFARPPNPTFRSFNLNTLLQETLSLLQPKIQTNQVAVVTDFCEAPMTIEGDEKQLRQVFLNLILNAVEAMPGGGRLSLSTCAFDEKLKPFGTKGKSYTPESGPEREFVKVVISDTGMGIPSEYKSYIFDPFFTTKEGGTGLGLSIVFSIVENHHGWIEVESSSNGGTSFKTALPIRQENRG